MRFSFEAVETFPVIRTWLYMRAWVFDAVCGSATGDQGQDSHPTVDGVHSPTPSTLATAAASNS